MGVDQADHPEVLVVGENNDVEPHMLFQAAKMLVNDPYIDFTHEDSESLHKEEDGATFEINTNRDDPDPIAFKSPLEYAVR
ncbi:hypothetical protein IDM40_19820 [Nocardiopsis sp. HNM0947]|uniref:Uncharacterized protein n=1 Tax=Nocardiopsis coralli TaxID=2772213 RepID=A0ABR9PAR5_9ACTN|nr:hypothetical protein [Nocardiopsis coralli]MBE3000922.1 hypothetical protein [Nocardiopsis coralli]